MVGLNVFVHELRSVIKNSGSLHLSSLLFSVFFLFVLIATWSQDGYHSSKYHILTLSVTSRKGREGQKSCNFVSFSP